MTLVESERTRRLRSELDAFNFAPAITFIAALIVMGFVSMLV
jgi:hypothetical protein